MDSSQDIVRAVAAIRRIDAVPTLLKVLCEMTGLRFAAVARVTGKTWTACAVRDDLSGCSMNARGVNCESNSLPFWAMSLVTHCRLSLPAASYSSADSPTRRSA